MISSQFLISLSFLSKKLITSLIVPRENNNTNIPLKKFIDTAILSGDSQNPHLIGWMRLNQNVINACQSCGPDPAGYKYHHNTPKFSPNTLG